MLLEPIPLLSDVGVYGNIATFLAYDPSRLGFGIVAQRMREQLIFLLTCFKTSVLSYILIILIFKLKFFQEDLGIVFVNPLQVFSTCLSCAYLHAYIRLQVL